MNIKQHIKERGYEIVTPTHRIVSHWWGRINLELWDGALPPPSTIEIKRDRRYWGWTHTHTQGKYDLDVDAYPLTRKRFIQVLSHESVHAWLWVVEGDNVTVHGPAFMQHRHRVRRRLGVRLEKEISI